MKINEIVKRHYAKNIVPFLITFALYRANIQPIFSEKSIRGSIKLPCSVGILDHFNLNRIRGSAVNL